MKKIGIVGVALVGLLLTGCAATAEPESAPTSLSPTVSSTASATTKPTPAVEPSGPPEQCVTSTPVNTDGDPIANAVGQTALPEDVHLMGTQVIASTDDAEKFDAVVRVCAEPMPETKQRELATTIARAVYKSGAGKTVAKFYVTAWVPDGESIEQAEPLHVDEFTLYLWDSQTANMDSNWKTRYDE